MDREVGSFGPWPWPTTPSRRLNPCWNWPRRPLCGRQRSPGAGPAILSRQAVADALAAGRLAEVAVDGLDLRRELRAVWATKCLTP